METKTRRRFLGVIFLGGALVTLVLGIINSGESSRAGAAALYWLVCFALTCGAMIVALRDLRAIRHNTAHEQRDLLNHMVHDIEDDAKRKKNKKNVANDEPM